MRVEFQFDPSKMAVYGYRMEQILATLKRVFFEDGFRCTSEVDVIIFEGNNLEEDFANMWLSIKDLINSSWFLKCAAACRWYDRSDNGKEELCEDVLAQADFLKRRNQLAIGVNNGECMEDILTQAKNAPKGTT